MRNVLSYILYKEKVNWVSGFLLCEIKPVKELVNTQEELVFSWFCRFSEAIILHAAMISYILFFTSNMFFY